MVKIKRYTKGEGRLGELGGSLDDLSIFWGGVGVRQWDAWIESIDITPIEQTWYYGQAFGGSTPYSPVHGVIYKKKSPIAIVQVIEWRIANLIKIAKIVRGPLFFDNISEEDRAHVFTLVRQRYSLRRLDFLLWTPELSIDDPAVNQLKNLGLREVVSGYSSVLINLEKEEDELLCQMDGKWRNQLKKAQKQGFRIKTLHGGSSLIWLLERHEAHRKQGRLRMPASAFISAIALTMRNKQGTLVFIAYDGSEPVAGVLIFKHGTTATYYVSWNSSVARKGCANNLLLWSAVKELKSRGVKWLDLGGVDGLSMPGVSRFKLGFGGRLYTLAGTYL